MSARAIIKTFGGIAPMARHFGHRHPSTIQGWWERNVIPVHQQANVILAARAAGIDIGLDDLIPGLTAEQHAGDVS